MYELSHTFIYLTTFSRGDTFGKVIDTKTFHIFENVERLPVFQTCYILFLSARLNNPIQTL